MPKKSTPKPVKTAPATTPAPVAPLPGPLKTASASRAASPLAAAPKLITPVAPAPQPASNGTSKAPRKPAAKKPEAPIATPAPKRAGARRKNGALPPPTTDEIALRAYFIAERRQQEGRYADPSEDWVEAERQILAERATA